MARIFQVAYDASLLNIRSLMLIHVGYEVSSALGNEQAQQMLMSDSDYDLLIVAWSASWQARREMVVWIKQHCPAGRVVSLKRGTEKPIPEADYNSQSEEPDEWFGTVRLAVAPG